MIFSCDSVLSLMLNQTLQKIYGKPIHKAIRKLNKELDTDLIEVDALWGQGKGHLGELQGAATFLQKQSTLRYPRCHASSLSHHSAQNHNCQL